MKGLPVLTSLFYWVTNDQRDTYRLESVLGKLDLQQYKVTIEPNALLFPHRKSTKMVKYTVPTNSIAI